MDNTITTLELVGNSADLLGAGASALCDQAGSGERPPDPSCSGHGGTVLGLRSTLAGHNHPAVDSLPFLFLVVERLAREANRPSFPGSPHYREGSVMVR